MARPASRIVPLLACCLLWCALRPALPQEAPPNPAQKRIDDLTIAGFNSYNEKEYAEAAKAWVEAFRLSQEAKYETGESNIRTFLNQIADVPAARALPLYDAVNALLAQPGDEFLRAYVLYCRGQVQRKSGLLDEALGSLNEASRAFEQLNDQRRTASCLHEMGFVYEDRKEFDLARGSMQSALTIYRQAENWERVSAVLGSLGLMAERAGDFDGAMDLLRESLDAAEKSGDQEAIALTLDNLGNTYYEHGYYSTAEGYFTRCLALKREIGDQKELARSLRDLAILRYESGDFARALQLFEEARKIAADQKDVRGEAICMANVALIAQHTGQLQKALKAYDEAAALFQKVGDERSLARAWGNQAVIYRTLEDRPSAKAIYERILPIFERTNAVPDYLLTLNNLANILDDEGDRAGARTQYEKTLAIAQQHNLRGEVARAHSNLGNALLVWEQPKDAVPHLEEALRIYREMGAVTSVASCLVNLGYAAGLQGDHEAALGRANEALQAVAAIPGNLELDRIYSLQGDSFRAMERFREGAEAYAKSADQAEQLRSQATSSRLRTAYFASQHHIYMNWAECLLNLKEGKPALEVVERARSRVLLDLLAAGRIPTGPEALAAETSHRNDVVERLAKAETRLAGLPEGDARRRLATEVADLRGELRSAEASVEAKQREVVDLRGSGEPARVDQVADMLGADAAVLEYASGAKSTILFVVTPGRPEPRVEFRVVEKGPEQIGNAVALFRKQCSTPGEPYEKLARELYDLLVAPAADLLKGARSLIISPDGPLLELPFHALMTPNHRHLVERFRISYAPSLSLLKACREHLPKAVSPRPVPALIVANPQYGDQQARPAEYRDALAPLPGSEAEARALQQAFGADAIVLTGQAASEEAVKREAGRCNVLHFATHARLNEANPMASAVMLAAPDPASGEDGVLEAAEIARLDWPAQLVVLSACQSGRGEFQQGEGMLGLSWSVFAAGVPSTLVSLWEVNDRSAPLLMGSFYGNWRKGLDKAGALQKAELEMLSRRPYRHPAHWAPFVLIGEWQ